MAFLHRSLLAVSAALMLGLVAACSGSSGQGNDPAAGPSPTIIDLSAPSSPAPAAAVYDGTITRWNDGRIKGLNPAVALPDIPIVPLHRAESSGYLGGDIMFQRSGAFGGIEAGVIIAALLMAAGSAWGFSRRLAEYR